MMRHAAPVAAILMLASLACADQPGMIRLAGTPEQIGTIFGELNREIILSDMEATYLKRAEAAGISRETLIERSAEYVRFAKEHRVALVDFGFWINRI